MVIKKGSGKLLISRGYSKKNNKPTTKKPKTKTQQNRNKNKQTKPQNNSRKKPTKAKQEYINTRQLKARILAVFHPEGSVLHPLPQNTPFW